MPGESKDVTLTLRTSDLAFYDPARKGWVAEPGDFQALIGTSSDNATNAVRFTLK